jgi:hypothetical protein
LGEDPTIISNSICIGKYKMIPKIIGAVFGLMAVGVFAWKFKETPLCRP